MQGRCSLGRIAVQGLGLAITGQLSLLVWTCRDSSFLTNRRVFAAADCGIPDGIKVDEAGNIWTGTGEGVAVYSPGQRVALHCSCIMSSALQPSPELADCLQHALMLAACVQAAAALPVCP